MNYDHISNACIRIATAIEESRRTTTTLGVIRQAVAEIGGSLYLNDDDIVYNDPYRHLIRLFVQHVVDSKNNRIALALLEANLNVSHAASIQMRTPILAAAIQVHNDQAAMALVRRVDVNLNEGVTLKNAIIYGASLQMINEIIQAGADVTIPQYRQNTYLHYAVSRDNGYACVALLATGNVDVNARNDKGDTPLFYARSLEVLRILLQAGADVFIRNNENHIALDGIPYDLGQRNPQIPMPADVRAGIFEAILEPIRKGADPTRALDACPDRRAEIEQTWHRAMFLTFDMGRKAIVRPPPPIVVRPYNVPAITAPYFGVMLPREMTERIGRFYAPDIVNQNRVSPGFEHTR